MCFATKGDPYPTLESKLSFLVSDAQSLKEARITNLEDRQPLMTLVKRDCPADFLPDVPLSHNAHPSGRRQRFTDFDDSYAESPRVVVQQSSAFEDFFSPLSDHDGKSSTPRHDTGK